MSVQNNVIGVCLPYEYKLRSNAAEAAKKCIAFGKDVVTPVTTQKWFKKFSLGNESLEDDARSGRPSNSTNCKQ